MTDYKKYKILSKKFKEAIDKNHTKKNKKEIEKLQARRKKLLKKVLDEQVMSGSVGSAPLHHGTLLPMIRRPSLGYGLVPFEGMVKKKKKKKKKKLNEVAGTNREGSRGGVSPHKRNIGNSLKYEGGIPIKTPERIFNKKNFVDHITSISIDGWGITGFTKQVKNIRKWKGFDEKKALQWAREAAGKPSTYLLMRKGLVGDNK